MLFSMCVASHSRDSIASIGADNRLRLWDARSGQLIANYPDASRASVKFVSIAYYAGSDAQNEDHKVSANGLVALGSNDGRIVIWDLHEAAVLQSIEAHGRAVNDVCFSRDGRRLLSASQDGTVCEWNVRDKRKIGAINLSAPVSRIALTNDNALLAVASSTIAVYDMNSKTVVNSFIGHSSNVRHLTFSWDGKLCASCADDRTVNVWSLNDNDDSNGSQKKKGKKSKSDKTAKQQRLAQSAVATISCRDSPLHISFRKDQASSSSSSSSLSGYFLAVSTAANAVEVCHIPSVSSSSKQQPTMTRGSCVVSAATTARNGGSQGNAREDKHQTSTRKTHVYDPHVSEHQDGHVIQTAFVDRDLFVLRGSFVQPVVQVVRCFGETDLLSKIDLPDLDASYLFGAKDSVKRKRRADSADTIASFPVHVNKKGKVSGDAQSLNQDASHAVHFSSSSSSSSTTISAAEAPKSGSVHTLLSQAVHSGDANLVEFCISRTGNNMQMLEDTIRRLPTQYIMPLLSIMIQKFRSKPSRGPMLLSWIRTLLRIHTAFLVAEPELSEELAPLYQTIDGRLGAFSGFLQLHGRLDFLMAQLNQGTENDAFETDSNTSQAVSAAQPKPMNVFNENDGEDESSHDGASSQSEDEEDSEELSASSDFDSN